MATPLALDKLVSREDVPNKVPDSVRYKRVEVSGTYDRAHEVVINNRSLDGAPGAWVLTPLIQADGSAVGVGSGDGSPWRLRNGTPYPVGHAT